MDALTHAVEAYIGGSTTKQTRFMAEHAVRLIYENLRKAYEDGQNKKARAYMLEAAYCAGLRFRDPMWAMSMQSHIPLADNTAWHMGLQTLLFCRIS